MKARIPDKIVPFTKLEISTSIVFGRPLPKQGLRQCSPFLLLNPMGSRLLVNHDYRIPPQAYRALMPVKLLFSGQLKHKDSIGGLSVLQAGDVGLLTASRGRLQSEHLENAIQADDEVFHAAAL